MSTLHYAGCKRIEASKEIPPRDVKCDCDRIRRMAERNLLRPQANKNKASKA